MGSLGWCGGELFVLLACDFLSACTHFHAESRRCHPKSLLKRNELRRPVEMSSWTLSFWRWLNELVYSEESPLAPGARRTLLSLIR